MKLNTNQSKLPIPKLKKPSQWVTDVMLVLMMLCLISILFNYIALIWLEKKIPDSYPNIMFALISVVATALTFK